MLPQLIFIGLVSVRQYSWSKNELKKFIEKINIPVLATLINNAKNKIVAKMVGLTLYVVDCWPLLLQTIFCLKIQEKNIRSTQTKIWKERSNISKSMWYCVSETRSTDTVWMVRSYIISSRNSKVAHVAPFLNQWKTSIKSSYQWRLLFLWIYFCTTNTPAFRQSGPFCVFEVKILLVCPEVLKKKANGKNHSLLRYTFEWQKSKKKYI